MAASKQAQIFSRGVFTHGITYELIWQSIPIGDPDSGYRTPDPPTVWKDIVIAGSALGDNPPFHLYKVRLRHSTALMEKKYGVCKQQ